MPHPNTRIVKLLRRYCEASAIAVMGVAFLVLVGWTFHIEWLKTVLPGFVTMKANTAIALGLSAISLWLSLPGESRTRKRQLAYFMATVVVLIGAVSLCEYVFDADLRIDQLIFRDTLGSFGTSSPGRMAPTSAIAFIAIGMALLFLDWKPQRGRSPAQLLSLCASLIAMLAISGYVYHAMALYKLLLYTQVALHTAIALALLSSAIFFARPKVGIAGDLTGEDSGGILARRLLPAVFFVPIFLGWMCLRGQIAGLYGTELALALSSSCNVVVFAVLVWFSARQLNAEWGQRNLAELAIRELNAELEARIARRTETLQQQTTVLAQQAALLDLAQDAIVVWDMNRSVVFWNRGAETLFGWPAKLAIGTTRGVLLKTQLPLPIEEIEAQVSREGYWEGESTALKRDGTHCIFSSRWALQHDASGMPFRTLSISSDITARKQIEEALFVEKERAQVTLNSIGDAVMCTDISGNITFLNAAAERMTGWPWMEAAGRPMGEAFRVLDASSRQPIPDPMHLAVVHNRTMNLPPNCILIRRGDALEIPIEDSVSPIHNHEGRITGAVIVFRDVSATRAMALQMTHAAQHDFLTGLPNRMLFSDRLSRAIVLARRHTEKVAVLFLDLDGFKHINDSLGHPIGDQLLQSVAMRLVGCVRGSDTVSRQGGDEFVVLLSEMQESENAALTAERMLRAVAEAHSIGQHDLHVTTSIGISVYPEDGQDAEELIENADTAMYQAKENGHQRYRFFKPAMNVRAVERQSLEEGLRRALERQEFELHYQPKVDMKTGEITGAEALIRWAHPVRGKVSPAEFIPVAEDCGLILPIGRWALKKACWQARTWLDAGLPLGTIAVNISAKEFREEHFLENIFEILKETDLDPKLLELELTESVLMKQADATASILSALRAQGIQLAIDDFGTGYSSLSYLTKFPIDALKIDQSFIRQISSAAGETAIVTAVISMGHGLNLHVVAEGVETREELGFLQKYQCDQAQGYYFSRPVPADEFAKLLETGIVTSMTN
jgi:diguanylate cyclase (GGDEF)-like protein/PAS domain S-box-containing protein